LAPHGDDKKKNPGTEQYGPNDRNTEHGKDSHHECYEEPGHPRYQKKKILLCEGVLGYVTADTTRLFSCTGISEMDPPYGVGEVFRW
jgi:hypothetical protein